MPKFSLNNCAQSSKKTFMCPKFRTNPVLKYIQCHISTNLSNFLKLCLLYCKKLLTLAPTNRRFAEKNWLSGNTVLELCQFFEILDCFHENVEKLGVKQQSKLKTLCVSVSFNPKCNFLTAYSQSRESKVFWYTLVNGYGAPNVK